MPIDLCKRGGSPYWYARGTEHGRRIFESLGTGDRREAQTLLEKLRRDIFDERARGPLQQAESFEAASIAYMEHGGERRFIAPLLGYFGATPIDQIDQKAIDRAAVAILPAGSNATRSRQVYTPVSAILRLAGIKLDMRRPKVPPGRVRWIEPDEAARLLDACSPHLRPLVMFLLLTGARASEALWLDWHCVDLSRAHVIFPKTKTQRPRGVALNDDLVGELANLPHRDGAVFRRPDGAPYAQPRRKGDDSAGSAIKTAFQGAVRRAGLSDFHVHDCRHTFATWHYREHRDLIALQTIGGWKTLSCVTRYAHASSENYRAGMNALPSLGAKSAQSNHEEKKAS